MIDAARRCRPENACALTPPGALALFAGGSAGAFPPAYVPTATAYLPSGAQPVPVYAAAGADADDTLELYRNLNSVAYSPAEASLVLRYGSAEFAVKTNESAPLRASVAALLAPYTAAPNASDLRNWYNVYDAFSVARLGVGDPMPAINATLWSQIVRPRSQRASRRAALTRAAVGR